MADPSARSAAGVPVNLRTWASILRCRQLDFVEGGRPLDAATCMSPPTMYAYHTIGEASVHTSGDHSGSVTRMAEARTRSAADPVLRGAWGNRIASIGRRGRDPCSLSDLTNGQSSFDHLGVRGRRPTPCCLPSRWKQSRQDRRCVPMPPAPAQPTGLTPGDHGTSQPGRTLSVHVARQRDLTLRTLRFNNEPARVWC